MGALGGDWNTDVSSGVDINSLFASDCLTTSQYHDRTYQDDPELRSIKNLMMAILNDAVDILHKYHGDSCSNSQRRLYDEARSWVENDCESYVFSFVPICLCLGLAPDSLRKVLLNPDFKKLFNARRSPCKSNYVITDPEDLEELEYED